MPQGPHCRLCTGLERPGTSSHASTRGRSPVPFLEVLEALLWGFHNSAVCSVCFPILQEAIAAKAGVPPKHGCGGPEGAGMGWRADLARTASPVPWCASGICSAAGRNHWDRDPHLQCLRVQRSENGASRPFFQLRRKIRPEHRTKILQDTHQTCAAGSESRPSSIADMDREGFAPSRDRQLAVLTATID